MVKLDPFTNSPFLFILSKFTTPPPPPAYLVLPNVPAPRLLGDPPFIRDPRVI